MQTPDIQPTPAHVEIQRGASAQAALDNPLIAEALSAWETEITRTWSQSPLRDVEGRERLRLMLEASKAFKSYLLQTMDTGRLARETMHAEMKMRQPAMTDYRVAPW